MNSKHVKEELSAYFDKILDAEEMLVVEEHLANCAECREEYEMLQETFRMLSSLEEVIPPASFRRELRDKLERSTGKRRISIKALIPNWMMALTRKQLIPVALVFLLMILIVPKIGSNLPGFRMGSSDKAAESITLEDTDSYNQLSGSEQMQKMMAPEGRGAGVEISTTAYTSSGEMPRIAAEPTGEDGNAPATVMEQDIERKIIKNADLLLQVDEYNFAVEALKQKVILLGGYVANENVNTVGREGTIYGYMQVRIPALEFEGFLSGIDGLGKVKNRNIYSQDVTEEYIDVESRLKALRTKEERLIDILTKSGQLSDILAVENELANTRAQLESLQGRLRYLNNRTDFSSISINIEQITASTQQISNPGFMEMLKKTKEAFIETINTMLIGTSKLVIFLGAAIPYLILLGIVVWLVWLLLIRKRT
ncbi:MAG: hypothetical protein CVU87_10435 [Firmicutes bacterium HGW-Firmicutes-12]|jgi:hypothetical protein|nr:MAG: hypothetical protein CVU87_10435 [Firmicutes bacterium HGW-Firmicutes-12]